MKTSWHLEEMGVPPAALDGEVSSYVLRCGPDLIGAITAKPADAHAMAAVPDLIDALEQIVRAEGTSPWVRSLARHALVIATGQGALT